MQLSARAVVEHEIVILQIQLIIQRYVLVGNDVVFIAHLIVAVRPVPLEIPVLYRKHGQRVAGLGLDLFFFKRFADQSDGHGIFDLPLAGYDSERNADERRNSQKSDENLMDDSFHKHLLQYLRLTKKPGTPRGC